MTRLRVAVTGVGGGCGQSIMQALGLSSLKIEVYPVDVTPLAAGLHTGIGGHVLPKPEQNLDAWRTWLAHNKIDALIPGSDHDLAPLAAVNEDWDTDWQCKLLVNNLFAVEVANDKALSAQVLHECGVDTPASAWKTGDVGRLKKFPMIVKPRYGMTSRGLNIVQDDEELNFHWKRTERPIVQEFIEGDEFTCGLFFDHHSNLKARFAMRRNLYAGSTHQAESGHYPQVLDFLDHFAAKTRQRLCWQGAINVQLKWHPDRGAVVFEINARCSGSTAIRAAFGYNEPEMLLRSFVLGETVTQPQTLQGTALRYADYLVIPKMQFSDFDGVARGVRGKRVQL
jgi:carbamoyl-phosphate synthase large subunit